MKTKDIEPGQDYAYQSYTSTRYRGAAEERVSVLATGVERKQGTHYYGTGSIVKNGVRVRFSKDASVRTVPSKNITRTWAEQEAINATQAESKRIAANDLSAQAARRAATGKQIEDILAEQGEQPREHTVRGNTHEQALMAEGFPEGAFGGILGRFDLDDWMHAGTLTEGAVTALLTEVHPHV